MKKNNDKIKIEERAIDACAKYLLSKGLFSKVSLDLKLGISGNNPYMTNTLREEVEKMVEEFDETLLEQFFHGAEMVTLDGDSRSIRERCRDFLRTALLEIAEKTASKLEVEIPKRIVHAPETILANKVWELAVQAQQSKKDEWFKKI